MAFSGVGVVLLGLSKNSRWRQQTGTSRARRSSNYSAGLTLDHESYLEERLRTVLLPPWNRSFLRATSSEHRQRGAEYWRADCRLAAEGHVVGVMLVEMPGDWHTGLLSLGTADHRLLEACLPSHAKPSDSDRSPTPTAWFKILDVVMISPFADADSIVTSSDPRLEPVINVSRDTHAPAASSRRDFLWNVHKNVVTV